MQNQRNNAFTIVELLIVIVVIAILAAITVVAYTGVQERANDSTVQSEIAASAKKLEAFNVENGRYPETSDELTATINKFALWYAAPIFICSRHLVVVNGVIV